MRGKSSKYYSLKFIKQGNLVLSQKRFLWRSKIVSNHKRMQAVQFSTLYSAFMEQGFFKNLFVLLKPKYNLLLLPQTYAYTHPASACS